MDRRQFLKSVGTRAVLGAGAATAAACSASTFPDALTLAQDPTMPEVRWQMPTSWPLGLDTLFGGARCVAERVFAMTGGKFIIEPRASGELVPGLEILSAVQEGRVSIGHTASYYYIGESPLTAFGAALPFGLTCRQQNAWLYKGGGLEILQEAYGERFGLIQFPAGNTGVQMGGWFTREVNSLADLQGLRMRIPGLGGQVMDRLGVNVQVLPGDEIHNALQTGSIDAAEWVGPYDDEKLGLHRVASFYYYPGWWEPGLTLEVQVNKADYAALPEEYQAILQTAAYEATLSMMASYDAKNPDALTTLLTEGDLTMLPFPDDVMQAAEEVAFELFNEFAASETDFGSIFNEWNRFRKKVQAWHGLAETSYLNFGAS